jgi:hypothetical protein
MRYQSILLPHPGQNAAPVESILPQFGRTLFAGAVPVFMVTMKKQ